MTIHKTADIGIGIAIGVGIGIGIGIDIAVGVNITQALRGQQDIDRARLDLPVILAGMLQGIF